MGHGLWHGIAVGDAKVHRDRSRWRSQNGKALHAIQLACGFKNLGKIRQFKTAREAWNRLKASFSGDLEAYLDLEQGRDHHIYELHNGVKHGHWNDAKSHLNRLYIYIYRK